MKETNYITAFCSVKNGGINMNHSITFTEKHESAAEFLKAAYKHYQMNYPKFYKMDDLCKLGFVASELLMRNRHLQDNYSSEDIAIVICNSSSSLEIDTEHQRLISDRDNYFPSPSVFVYTLPNITIGEIAIRNNIKGENTFFIFDKFDAEFMAKYVDSLLDTGKAASCLAGWIELFEGNYHGFLYTVEKQAGVLNTLHTAENLQELFK